MKAPKKEYSQSAINAEENLRTDIPMQAHWCCDCYYDKHDYKQSPCNTCLTPRPSNFIDESDMDD